MTNCMTNIELFMDKKLALDLAESDPKDIQTLSDYIDDNYDKSIYFKEKTNTWIEYNNLMDYYKIIANRTVNKWEILVYEKDLKLWNAYRGRERVKYLEKYPKMTAAEILRDKQVEISEKDMVEFLCLM